MNSWLKESTRIFVDNLLKEDLGLGHMVDDGQTKTILVSPREPTPLSNATKIQQLLLNIDTAKLTPELEKKLEKVYEYLRGLNM
jgi:hypothetical protein